LNEGRKKAYPFRRTLSLFGTLSGILFVIRKNYYFRTMRPFLLSLIAFLSMSAYYGQQSRYLAWDSKEPLQWNHFQGKSEADDHVHGAVTYAGIELVVDHVSFPGGNVRFKAHAIFDQKRSWVKEGKPDRALLSHEQLHFDITEVYARKLMHKLNELRLSKKDKANVKKWQNRYWQAQLNTQNLYDRESVHGLHVEQQKAWRKLVDKELRQTDSQLSLQPKAYAVKK
jgi:hypothetical protein